MVDAFFEQHWLDVNGNPAGGTSSGKGFAISWQNGPLGRGSDRREPNGAFVETITKAVIGRLEVYQASRFACDDNAEAIKHLEAAVECMQRRTKNREQRQVEGTRVT